MEANRQRRYSGTSYIEGNAARKLTAVPERPIREREYTERREPSKRQVIVPRRKAGIDLLSFLILSVAIAITMYLCVDFIQVQSDLTQMEKKIVSLEKDVKVMKSHNDALYSELQTSVDLRHVYEIAVGELGMVYPNNNEVINYQCEAKDYVIQYQDIPEVDAKPLDFILK